MNRVVYAIFGGICSGKSTLASALAECFGCQIVSKDKAIYEADRKARETGFQTNFEDFFNDQLRESIGRRIILDKTIRAGDLSTFVANEYVIIGLQLVGNTQQRKVRLDSRTARQAEIVTALENLLSIGLGERTREERQELWRNRDFWTSLDLEVQSQAELLLERIYGTGSHLLKPEYPNVVNFPEVNYVCEFDTSNPSIKWDLNETLSSAEPWEIYRYKKMTEIEHVIFDVGGVVYDYSKSPLRRVIEEAGGNSNVALDFDDYMRGLVDLTFFCRSIAERTGAHVNDRFCDDVFNGLRRGRQEPRRKVLEAMQSLTRIGVKVSVLSNAIPALQSGEPYYDIVPPERRFFSFEIGLLKPDHRAYIYALDHLSADPTKVLFVDDKPKNVRAAQEVGMHGFVFCDLDFETKMAPYLRN